MRAISQASPSALTTPASPVTSLLQPAVMDVSEKLRRLKRSLDGFISFRKAVFIIGATLMVVLYLGPSFFDWLLGESNYRMAPVSSCVDEKFLPYSEDLRRLNAHGLHNPWRPLEDVDYVPYVGNGHIGLAILEDSADRIHIFGGQRHLNLAVPLSPVVRLTIQQGGEADAAMSKPPEYGAIVHYTKGLVHTVRCLDTGTSLDGSRRVSVSSQIYAHRTIPAVLVQEIRAANPTEETVHLSVDRVGILDWKDVQATPKTLDYGDGNQKYIVVAGLLPLPGDSARAKYVVIVMKKLPSTLEVAAKMSKTFSVVTSVAYSTETVSSRADPDEVVNLKEKLQENAIQALLQAVSMTQQDLREKHLLVWQSLWTTGFGISHSMADNAVNGGQINATMYYVLSQSPALVHSEQATEEEKKEVANRLAYAEGCYGGTPTIQAASLWRPLFALEEVNVVVRAWMVTLEKNGCSKLLKAGADGVSQAMVLSYAALEFREDHLELNSHPKDLHRDYYMRRVSYGNATHLNISIVVQADNKPIIIVALDRRNRDYFACDAGCLDPPVKLSTEPKKFPVKLTEPVTAIFYITSESEHMEELKHAIHFNEMVEAPAHEHHVLALHRHGNKLGGLPAIFWFSIAFLVLVFHMFLFKLIWQEYCASQDKFRSRKFSDYQ